MKIVTRPRVYLVGRTQVDQEVVRQFLDEEATTWQTDGETGSELLCELAGRVCYLSFGDKQGRRSNHDYLTNIIAMEHGSVLEHAAWSFIVTGVSRSFSHELIRHRAGWAYSQLSQRYVDESDAAYVEPDIIAANPELHDIWLQAVEMSHGAYVRLAQGLSEAIKQQYPALPIRDKRKKAREAARSVLPNATETKIFMTANARALRHFVEYRGAPDAEPEIRRVALAVLQIMRVEAPALFGDYDVEFLSDGSGAAATPHKKI
ncbi:MAG: FAD-dependent thymidylate synthase [Chloroflexota bacterium]|nr:MAG: FAD-dependent thymidylate synthase [Chloroflexota bacterium]